MRLALLRSLSKIAHAESSRLSIAASGTKELFAQSYRIMELKLEALRPILLGGHSKILDKKLDRFLGQLRPSNSLGPSGLSGPSWESLIESQARKAKWSIGFIEATVAPELAQAFDDWVTRTITHRGGVVIEILTLSATPWRGRWRYCCSRKLSLKIIGLTPDLQRGVSGVEVGSL
jgi:hypothetical protein